MQITCDSVYKNTPSKATESTSEKARNATSTSSN